MGADRLGLGYSPPRPCVRRLSANERWLARQPRRADSRRNSVIGRCLALDLCPYSQCSLVLLSER
jgi:hypothetical protein